MLSDLDINNFYANHGPARTDGSVGILVEHGIALHDHEVVAVLHLDHKEMGAYKDVRAMCLRSER